MGLYHSGYTACSFAKKEAKDKCFIDFHSIFIDVAQPCNGTTVEYYQNTTDNHNKASITIENFTECTLIALIETRDGKSFEVPVIAVEGPFGGLFGERAITVENLCRISVRCEGGGPTATCQGGIDIDLTFCICCPGHKSTKHSCDC
ncbi:hypothetical protein AB685_16820 [Bacillus sp. LL01]|uniref:S-Ena type endospore appendage n=1 Tax=Bacillus sp. LL01 TaxID=1665556 RepID=UPI00064CF341|nr:S-Ena type endospore appendage [Bacillus sp. LL01]KMJ57653.1 hypothetical protein AB685_16820 [Bacillus sp. LL01]